MENTILLDSNILIAAFRRNEDAVSILSNKNFNFAISDITTMELFAGCKTVEKRKEMENILKFYAQAPFTQNVSQKAIALIKRYAVSRNTLHLPDILIAATALNYNLPLKTLNTKDFDFIREITLL
ncbi:MAG: type II toxin-antitoxin system VapC family toxin [Clostridia bacterium]|nr:type II toxin-antitoxin system VapC family toxin [Clostridia bacterium]